MLLFACLGRNQRDYMSDNDNRQIQEIRKRLDEATRKMVFEYSIRIEKLTEEQTVSALRQAIECGDFQRLVSPHGQQVVYEPFRREQELLARIARLESAEHEAEITRIWRHKVHILAGVVAAARPFLKARYADRENDEHLGKLLDDIAELNL